MLVSDFDAAYDARDCPQQKCLLHLVRDFNNDIQANPWDEELKSLGRDFGGLLRAAVATRDLHGLKTRYLSRHKPDVARFFESVGKAEYRSELADGYRKRLLKCQGKLFTFLDHDGVPWNNNNAEHAVKRFAYYREVTDGSNTEGGLSQYLVLLSLCLTCKFKDVSFLKFLLSRETDIDQFCEARRGKQPVASIELYPEGMKSRRKGRKRGGVEAPRGECRTE